MVNTFQVACCPHNIIRKIPCKHRYFQVRNRLDPRELIIQILLLTYCKGANPMSSDIMSGSLGVQRPISPIWGEFLLSCGSSRWYLSLRSSTRMLTFREGKKKKVPSSIIDISLNFKVIAIKVYQSKISIINLISIASGGRVIVIVSSFCLDINLNLSKFIVL